MTEPTRPLGRPIQKPRPAQAEITASTANLEIESSDNNQPSIETTHVEKNQAPNSGRGRDNTLGRPIQKPKEMELSNVSLADLEREEMEAEAEEVFYQPIKLPIAWLSGVWLIVLLFSGVIGWFVFAQIMSTVQTILQLPLVIQAISWLLVAFFSFIIIYPLTKLLIAYRRLKPVKQIKMTKVTTRNLSANQLNAAKQNIVQYLQDYPLDESEFYQQLKKLGLSKKEQQKLLACKNQLLDSDLKTTPAWLQSFEQDFLKPLDKVIHARIQHYAKLLALKTALSPNALIDMAVVLYNGFSLLREICLLYQVRVGRFGTLYLLGLVIFQSYVAGQIEQNMGGVENWIEDMLQNTVLGATGAKVASIAGAKASEAAVHYFFLRRIGKSMMLRLRPLSSV